MEVIKELDMSKNGFATSIGHRNLTKSLAAHKAASTKILLAIHHHFPQINLDWLLTGRGSMWMDQYEQNTPLSPARDLSFAYQNQSINNLIDSLQELTEVVKQKL